MTPLLLGKRLQQRPSDNGPHDEHEKPRRLQEQVDRIHFAENLLHGQHGLFEPFAEAATEVRTSSAMFVSVSSHKKKSLSHALHLKPLAPQTYLNPPCLSFHLFPRCLSLMNRMKIYSDENELQSGVFQLSYKNG